MLIREKSGEISNIGLPCYALFSYANSLHSQRTGTVLCKSNASELRKFRSLFSRTFDGKFECKVVAFRAKFRLNKARQFSDSWERQQNFANISVISLASSRNFAEVIAAFVQFSSRSCAIEQ